MRKLCAVFSLIAALGSTGCASYVTPGGAISIPAITEGEIGEALAREPAASFPARIIVARAQAPGYVSYSNRGYGQGRFSVLTARDIETDEDFARLGAMPGVASVAPLSRILLPLELESTRDLRTAAAQLRGDILFLYTLDTSFRTDTLQIGPLQAMSLGFFPNKTAYVTATCAAAFIDVRTGYVYGVAEASALEEQRSNVWNTTAAIENARGKAERQAFAEALDQVEETWDAIATQYAGGNLQ